MIQWYSTLSTGILEIDQQHASLDRVLEYVLLCKPAERLHALRRFAHGVKAHFTFEERYLMPDDTPFTDDAHILVHRQIEELVDNALIKAKTGMDDPETLAMDFSRILMGHAAEFDMPAAKRAKEAE